MPMTAVELRGARRAARDLRRRRRGPGDGRAADRPRRTRPRRRRRARSRSAAWRSGAMPRRQPARRCATGCSSPTAGSRSAPLLAVLDRATGSAGARAALGRATRRMTLAVRGRARRAGRPRHYNGFFLHAEHSQMAVYYAPFVAVPAGAAAPRGAGPRARGGAARRGVARASWSSPARCLALSDANDDDGDGARPRRLDRGAGVGRRGLPGGRRRHRGQQRDRASRSCAAPFLTSLYVLAERADPVSAIVAAARHVPRGWRTSGPRSPSSSATAYGSPITSRRVARGARANDLRRLLRRASSRLDPHATSHTCKR